MAVIYALFKVHQNVQSSIFVHQKIYHRRNRPHFSANGPFLLLPLALKWGLAALLTMCLLPCLGGQSVAAVEFDGKLTITIPGALTTTVKAAGAGDPATAGSATSIGISSTARWGYTLTVSSDSENGALKNGTNELPSITQEATDLNGFGTMGWGFKVTGTGVTNTNYRKAPTKTAPAQIVTTKGNSGSEESGNYSFQLAAKVDNTLAAGTYSGSMTFEATANEATYSISYQKGSVPNESEVTQMPSEQDGEKTPNSTITISNAEDPDHPKYVFMGWCEGEVQKDTDGIDACNGTTYQRGDTYTLKNEGQTITLIAMWGRKMQNWDECGTLTESKSGDLHEITLVDSRDRKRYYVAKLADNNCWMVENLDFDIQKKTYTSADTDLAKQSGYTWTVTAPTHPESEIGATYWNGRNSSDGVNNTGGGENTPQSYDPGDYCWKTGEIYTTSISSNTVAANARVVKCSKHQTVTGSDPHYYIGNYYNYAAAVAQNDTSSKKTAGDSYETSICPAGWQLPPNGTGDKSYQNLYNQAKNKGYTLTSGVNGNIQNAPYWFGYSGFWRGVSYHIGYSAYYRSSAVSSATRSYNLSFDGTGYLYPQNSGGWRLDGFSVRCVAR